MKRYSDEQIEHAKELRTKFKYSFTYLHKITGIPATTISNWCRGELVGTRWDTLQLTNERKRQELKLSETKAVDSFEIVDKNIAKIFVAIMYWCEGSKYPSSNKVDFVNSDPKLANIFIKLLRTAFTIDDSKLRVKLQIHDAHKFELVRKYWSGILSIPESRFMKPTITKATGKKHRKEYLGTCTIRYPDYRIQLKLIGIYEALAEKLI